MSKRADRRIDFKPPKNAVIKTKTRQTDVLLTDISCSGLRFLTKDQFEKGEKVSLELLNDDEMDFLNNLKAKIKNEYGKSEDGSNIYGVKFFRISCWYERTNIHTYIYSEIKKKNIL